MSSRPSARTAPAPRGRFALWSVNELLDLPEVDWLLEGMIQAQSLSVAYGQSGEGKTFIVLDWALSVATGLSWIDRSVKQGPVVYVVAEGGRSIQKRVAAWMTRQRIKQVENAFFVLQAVQLRNQDDFSLITSELRMSDVKPALIVLDTFARCFVGGDENASKDVGEFIGAVQKLQEQTGAAVLLVHHTGKNGEQERGSSALRAAADSMFRIARGSNGNIAIKNDKQKDTEECDTISVRLHSVSVGDKSAQTSCVVERAGEASSLTITDAQRTALEVLAESQTQDGMSTGAWRDAVGLRLNRAVASKTFDNWRTSLLRSGFIEVVVSGLRNHYRITDAGIFAVVDGAIGAPSGSHVEDANTQAATATPL